EPRHAEAVVTGLVRDARLFADVGERPVAVVVEEVIGRSLQPARPTHNALIAILARGHPGGVCRPHPCGLRIVTPSAFTRLPASRGAARWRRRIVYVEIHIACDEQIEPSVAVVISERAAG